MSNSKAPPMKGDLKWIHWFKLPGTIIRGNRGMHSASEIKKKYNSCVTFSKNQIISKTLNMMNYP